MVCSSLFWAFSAWQMWRCMPAGAMTAIAFMHNLLRRHPACTVLLHRPPSTASVAQDPSGDSTEHINAASARQDAPAALMPEQPAASCWGMNPAEGKAAEKRRKALEQDGMQPGSDSGGQRHSGAPSESAHALCNGTSAAEAGEQGVQAQSSVPGPQQMTAGVDVYSVAEDDPAKSRAVESSLWEIEALRNHYCPQVSTVEGLTPSTTLTRPPWSMPLVFQLLKRRRHSISAPHKADVYLCY